MDGSELDDLTPEHAMDYGRDGRGQPEITASIQEHQRSDTKTVSSANMVKDIL